MKNPRCGIYCDRVHYIQSLPGYSSPLLAFISSFLIMGYSPVCSSLIFMCFVGHGGLRDIEFAFKFTPSAEQALVLNVG